MRSKDYDFSLKKKTNRFMMNRQLYKNYLKLEATTVKDSKKTVSTLREVIFVENLKRNERIEMSSDIKGQIVERTPGTTGS